ncbi:MAG: acyl-CoA dehydrogenase family protein [Promethearchaeota archaeon]
MVASPPGLLEALLSVDVPPAATFDEFWTHYAGLRDRSPFDRAVLAARRVATPAFAFAAGYQSALRALVPDLPDGDVVTFCVTEEVGGHPRALRATLSPAAGGPGGGFSLSGRKVWASLGREASLFLVVAKVGEDEDGRSLLKTARVLAGSPGVSVAPQADAPLLREVSHCVVEFKEVRVDPADVLPGDGYDDHVKPFRTLEDVHVTGAVLACLLGAALRGGWPAGEVERCVALLLSLRELAAADPRSPATHVALGGALSAVGEFWASLDERERWRLLEPAARRTWRRDSALFHVASRARAARLAAAWKDLKQKDAR